MAFVTNEAFSTHRFVEAEMATTAGLATAISRVVDNNSVEPVTLPLVVG